MTAKPVLADGSKRASDAGLPLSRSCENATLTWRQPAVSSVTRRSNSWPLLFSSYRSSPPPPVPRNQNVKPSCADQSVAAMSCVKPNQSPAAGAAAHRGDQAVAAPVHRVPCDSTGVTGALMPHVV